MNEVIDWCGTDLIGTTVEETIELKMQSLKEDVVNHPSHYTSHPSGIECIQVTEHMSFCIGNAIKYLWRCGLKYSDKDVEDMRKAVWYINREITRRGGTP